MHRYVRFHFEENRDYASRPCLVAGENRRPLALLDKYRHLEYPPAWLVRALHFVNTRYCMRQQVGRAYVPDHLKDDAHRGISIYHSVVMLMLSTRTENLLRRDEIVTVGELICHNEEDLLRCHGVGKSTISEIRIRLGKLGYKLLSDDAAPTFSYLWTRQEDGCYIPRALLGGASDDSSAPVDCAEVKPVGPTV